MDRDIEVSQACQRFQGHRTRQHVTADDYLVDTGESYFGEDSLERRQVAVNIVESGHTHGIRLSYRKEGGA